MAPPTVADDDSDLDDLDDLLPSFSAPAPALPASQPGPSAHHGAAADGKDDDDDDEAFAAELAKGMEGMLRDLGVDLSDLPPPSASASGKQTKEADERSWEEAFEAALRGQAGGEQGSANSTAPKAAGTADAGKGDFQNTIKETMDRLKTSSESNTQSGPADPLEALLASLGLGEGGEGAGEEGVLERMMDGLMSKDVLYEPMKDLAEKYPPYLASSQASQLDPAQLHSYRAQSDLVSQIVALFEAATYSEDDEGTRKEIQELMGKMQDLGSPPKEVMGDMPDLEMGPDGMPKLPEGMDADGCTIS